MEDVARQLLRVLRGFRSQLAFSRRLGYRSNPVAEWEAGRRFPTAAELIRVCRVLHLEVDGAFRTFHPEAAPLLGRGDGVGIAAWLDALRGREPIQAVAARVQRSRFAVARWLAGTAEPRLPDFLALVEAITGRVADLVALLAPIGEIPALAARHGALEAGRRLAREQPWSGAVVAVLDTAPYRALPAHREGVIAALLGIPVAAERACLVDLLAGGVIERDGDRYLLRRPLVIDTGGEPEVMRRIRAHWLDVARARTLSPRPDDAFAYNVFSVKSEDLDRIRELYRSFFREVRQIVAASEPTDTVALLAIQLIDWPAGPTLPAGQT